MAACVCHMAKHGVDWAAARFEVCGHATCDDRTRRELEERARELAFAFHASAQKVGAKFIR